MQYLCEKFVSLLFCLFKVCFLSLILSVVFPVGTASIVGCMFIMETIEIFPNNSDNLVRPHNVNHVRCLSINSFSCFLCLSFFILPDQHAQWIEIDVRAPRVFVFLLQISSYFLKSIIIQFQNKLVISLSLLFHERGIFSY